MIEWNRRFKAAFHRHNLTHVDEQYDSNVQTTGIALHGDDGRITMEIVDEEHIDLKQLQSARAAVSMTFDDHDQSEHAAAAPSLQPPDMNVCIMIVGTRGDVQPFVAIALRLQKDGHRVRLATHAVYRDFVMEHDVEFYPLGGDPKELAAYMVKTGGHLIPLKMENLTHDIPKNMQMIEEIIHSTWPAVSAADPDGEGKGKPGKPFQAHAIISNPVTYGHIHVAERLGVPLHIMFPQPWVPTVAFPHPLSNLPYNNKPQKRNYMSYKLVELLMWQGTEHMINEFRTQVLGLRKIRKGDGGRDILLDLAIPHAFMWSPLLVPRPNDWTDIYDVIGTVTLKEAGSKYTPTPELEAFLGNDGGPIFVGFGSMVIEDTVGTTRMIIDAANQANVRVLIQSSWSDMAGDLEVPDNIFFLGNCPHDWLMPRVRAVVHHGGAGTTAAGLMAGKPTFIVPFFGDQPFWGRAVVTTGVGVEPCPIHELTTEKLRDAFTQLMGEEIKQRAEAMRDGLLKEDGAAEAVRCFYRHLPKRDMLCDVDKKNIATKWSVNDRIKMCEQCHFVIGLRRENFRKKVIDYHSVDYSARGPANGWIGASAGAGAFLHELGGAMKDVIVKPARGYREEGTKGAVIGVAKGIGGLLIRPIHGVALFADHIAAGHCNQYRTEGTRKRGSVFDTHFMSAIGYENGLTDTFAANMDPEHIERQSSWNAGKKPERRKVSLRLSEAEKEMYQARFEELIRLRKEQHDTIDGFESAKSPSSRSELSQGTDVAPPDLITVRTAQCTDDGNVDMAFHLPEHTCDVVDAGTISEWKAFSQRQRCKQQQRVEDVKESPVPRMNICLATTGSWQDSVNQFVAVGLKLARDGHRVRIAAHGMFRQQVLDRGLEFYPLAGEPTNVHDVIKHLYAMKNATVFQRLTAQSPVFATLKEMIFSLWPAAVGPDPDAFGPGEIGEEFRADVLISHPMLFGHVDVAQRLGIPLHMMCALPCSPTLAFPHILSSYFADADQLDGTYRETNCLTYGVVDTVLWRSMQHILNDFRAHIGLHGTADRPSPLVDWRIPYTYLWNPLLLEKPLDWGSEIAIAGYVTLDDELEHQHLRQTKFPRSLVDFTLQTGNPVIYFGLSTFMVTPDQVHELMQRVDEAAQIASVQVIFRKCDQHESYVTFYHSDNVYEVASEVPFAAILRKVVATVNCGDAYVVSETLRAGKPLCAVPRVSTQWFWSTYAVKAGVALPPIDLDNYTVDELVDRFRGLLDPAIQERAQKFASTFDNDLALTSAVDAIYSYLPLPAMVCDLNEQKIARIYDSHNELKLSYEAHLAIRPLLTHDHREDISYKPLRYEGTQPPKYSLRGIRGEAHPDAAPARALDHISLSLSSLLVREPTPPAYKMMARNSSLAALVVESPTFWSSDVDERLARATINAAYEQLLATRAAAWNLKMKNAVQKIAGKGRIKKDKMGSLADVVQAVAAYDRNGRINLQFDEDDDNYDISAIQQREEQLQIASTSNQRQSSTGADNVPVMNICIMIVGTRGDVQPFLGIAKLLQQDGHRVRLATHAVYRDFVMEHDVEFYPLGGDPKELAAYMVKTGGHLIPLKMENLTHDIPKNMQMIEEIIHSTWPAVSAADPDGEGKGKPGKPFQAHAIISNPVTYGHIHVAERLGVPLHIMFPQPWVPTVAFPHPLSNLPYNNKPQKRNYMSYKLVELLMWQGTEHMINEFRTQVLGLRKIRKGDGGRDILLDLAIPHAFMWSPLLVPRPNDWTDIYDVIGTVTLKEAGSKYTPTPELEAFLGNDGGPIFVGFGSMVIEDTVGTTRMIIDAANQANVRVLIQSSWSDMAGDLEVPDNIFFLGNCPHDWLMPRVRAVVHHGGAGTTAAGLMAGKPTFIVPFFGDQPFWGRAVVTTGVGVEPCPIHELTTEKLRDAFTQLMGEEIKQRAEAMRDGLLKEDGAAEAVRCFYRHLPKRDMLCDVDKKNIATKWSEKDRIRMPENCKKDIVDYHSVDYSARGPNSTLQGAASGAGAFLHELGSGVKDVFIKPANGYRDEGAKGAVIGLAKGLGGLFIKPIHGAALFADHIATGHYNKHRGADERKKSSVLLENSKLLKAAMGENVAPDAHTANMKPEERALLRKQSDQVTVAVPQTEEEKQRFVTKFEELMGQRDERDEFELVRASSISSAPDDQYETIVVQSAETNENGNIEIKFANGLEHDAVCDSVLFQMKEAALVAEDNQKRRLEDLAGKHVPAMNICMITTGNWDENVQQFVAIGLKLKADGHRVRIATTGGFRKRILAAGLEFFPLGGKATTISKYLLYLHEKSAREARGVRRLSIIREEFPELDDLRSLIFSLWPACTEADPAMPGQTFRADAIISHPLMFGQVFVAERLGVPLHCISHTPMTKTQAFPHLMSSKLQIHNPFRYTPANAVSYDIVIGVLWKGMSDVLDEFRSHIGLTGKSESKHYLNTWKIPHTYLWNPELLTKPMDWYDEISIAGYMEWEQEPPVDPQESVRLSAIANHLDNFVKRRSTPLLYFGFSRADWDSRRMAQLFEAIEHACTNSGVRVIFQTYEENDGDKLYESANVLQISQEFGYRRLLKMVDAVLHWGDLSITSVGLAAGKPTCVIPRNIPQKLWGQTIVLAGVGVEQLDLEALTAGNLAHVFSQLLAEPLRTNAQRLAQSFSTSQAIENTVKFFYANLPLEGMTCDLDPSRIARIYDIENGLKLSYEAHLAIREVCGHDGSEDLKYKPLKYSLRHPPRYSLKHLQDSIAASAPKMPRVPQYTYAMGTVDEDDPPPAPLNIVQRRGTLQRHMSKAISVVAAPEFWPSSNDEAQRRIEINTADSMKTTAMSRRNPLRISVVDESTQSPRINEDEGMSDWRWNTTNAAYAVAREQSAPDLRNYMPSPSTDPAQRAFRRSASPRLRGDIVMEKIMNPHLDRDASSGLLDGGTPTRQATAAIDTPERPARSHVKATVFDDAYHSVYVPSHSKGLAGFFVLMQSPVLLMAIGIFSGFIGLFVDFWLAKISVYHNYLTDLGFRYFLVSALVAVSFSAALVHLVCPQAAGSGLPFMKVAISGVDMSDYLSLRCVVTKIVGLVAAFAAGLSIGKEGPFIMMACGFASILMNTPLFERINADETKRLEMLACACAAGVAATFGSPFGGVLFGVEVTSHFYMVRTLPRSFFAAIIGALVVNFVTQNARYGLFGNSNLGITEIGDLHPFTLRDLAVFILIGIACGLGGACFNYCISILVRLRDKFLAVRDIGGGDTKLQHFWNGLGKRLLLVCAITFISCLTEFYGDSAWFIRHGSPHRIIAALFSKDKQPFAHQNLPGHPNTGAEDDDDSVLLSRSLVTYLPLKYVLTLLSVVLPIPAGLFTPTFVIGGIFGRLIGEAISAFDIMDTQYEPFEYAIIGAGAFSSGVTHAISTGVIIMEVSHNDGLNLPVSVAILAAYFTAKRFTDNVYDMLITTSHLPRPKKLPKAAYDIPSWEVMRDVKDMKVLTADSTYADALRILRTCKEPIYPIVDSHDNLFLLATVTRRRLEAAVAYCQQKMREASSVTMSLDATAQSSAMTPKTPLDAAGIKPSAANLYAYGSTESLPLTAEIPAAQLAINLKINLLDWPIHFAFRRGGKIMDWGTNELCTRTKLTVLVNPSPFQIMEMTPMKRVDVLFRMLKLNNAYVTRSGRLVGVISRDRLMTFLGKSSKYKVPGLVSTMTSCCLSLVDRVNHHKKDEADKIEYMAIP
ncbi:TPA: hypothetical protein N0F65_007803 [Lagenidium giganteum]|uniref:Sterol 3-beta-glucosyltransferase n=1 Tax=Lagenidium giganteum TaxID=4803 RepID=A0AAV2YYN6_9STRA|nr:TPA: hypothetical protein N0F65_007803 [Lagenidium giganteum]